jgi:hypothetical protein
MNQKRALPCATPNRFTNFARHTLRAAAIRLHSASFATETDEMRKAAALGLLALGVVGVNGIRAADYQAAASLERALPGATDTEIDGINWRCTGAKCVGTPVGRTSIGSRMEECRKVAAALGRLSSFSSRGKDLNKRDLDNCNRSAR